MPGVTTRERLIESTQQLLWERGYVGTSPNAILRHAGVGQGSMYHHFDGKPALALAAIRRSADQLRARAEAQFTREGTAFQRISGYLNLEREVLRGCPIGRLAQDPEIIASSVLRAPVKEMFEWLRHRLADVIVEGQTGGELAADLDPVATAAALVAALQGGYVLARAVDSVEPFEQVVHGALALLEAKTVSR